MQIKLDEATESALRKKARRQGKTVAQLLEELVKDGSIDPSVTIYDKKNGSFQMRFDSAQDPQKQLDNTQDPDLINRVREDVARDAMIARMQRRDFVAGELSEAESRQRYIERMKSRRR